jgi:hypothetical protein
MTLDEFVGLAGLRGGVTEAIMFLLDVQPPYGAVVLSRLYGCVGANAGVISEYAADGLLPSMRVIIARWLELGGDWAALEALEQETQEYWRQAKVPGL